MLLPDSLIRRFKRQIETVVSVFDETYKSFIKQKPIDRKINLIFRQNPRFGSRDRKYISNSIFGYFRWYGWLRQIPLKNRSLSLLLGYLLDNNKRTDLIDFWAERCGLDNVYSVFNWNDIGIHEKSMLISRFVSHSDPSQLNPDFVPPWPPGRLEAFQQRAPTWIRLREINDLAFTRLLEDRNISYTHHETQPGTLELKTPANFYEFAHYKNGCFEVQDISSQGVGILCAPSTDEIWWDMCAGSGGKALHLSSLTRGTGTIYATEIDPHMYKQLRKRVSRHNSFSNIIPIQWNGIAPPAFKGELNGILIDAPCSCSGTWRRAPDLRWTLSRARVADFASLQLKLLNKASHHLPIGGHIVYSTCSIFPEENEAVIQQFIDQNPSYHVREMTCPFTRRSYRNGINFCPPDVNGNGMFVAKLTKRGPR